MQQAAAGTADVTRNIAGVSEGATSTGGSAAHVLDAATTLSHEPSTLEGEVRHFVIEVKAA